MFVSGYMTERITSPAPIYLSNPDVLHPEFAVHDHRLNCQYFSNEALTSYIFSIHIDRLWKYLKVWNSLSIEQQRQSSAYLSK